MEEIVADATQWMKQVAGALEEDFCPTETLNNLTAAADDLRVELTNVEELKEGLAFKIAAQALDQKLAPLLEKPTHLQDLKKLHAAAVDVNSKSSLFKRLDARVSTATAWQLKTDQALSEVKFTVSECEELIAQGKSIASDGVIVNGVENLQAAVNDATEWIERTNSALDWDKADISDLRSLAKQASGVKVKMPELELIHATISTVNGWLAQYRKLIPKRVNKKTNDNLQELHVLEALLRESEKVRIMMDEKEQLHAIVEEAHRLKATISQAFADHGELSSDDGVKKSGEELKSWKELLKEAESSPVLMPELAQLREQIKERTATLSWRLKAQDAIDSENISESKLEALLNDAGKSLKDTTRAPPELAELKGIAVELEAWREEVESTLNEQQPDRIQALEKLLAKVSDLGVDVRHSETMERLNDSLK
eukprot:SAG11_NODE_1621_length_4562_cov_2.009187_2_plen_427_part_00